MGQSIGSYYSKIMGSANFDRVIGPAMTAVISQKADDFPAEMLFKKRPRRKDVIKSFTLSSGLQTIADTIAIQKNIEIIRESEVRQITTKHGLFQIAAGGASYETRTRLLLHPHLLQHNFCRHPSPLCRKNYRRSRLQRSNQ